MKISLELLLWVQFTNHWCGNGFMPESAIPACNDLWVEIKHRYMWYSKKNDQINNESAQKKSNSTDALLESPIPGMDQSIWDPIYK